jgi:hypothetical protein
MDPYIKECQKIKHTRVADAARATPWNLKVSLLPSEAILRTLPLSHRLHLLATDLLERRSNRSNNISPNQLQCQPPLLRWRHPRNWPQCPRLLRNRL